MLCISSLNHVCWGTLKLHRLQMWSSPEEKFYNMKYFRHFSYKVWPEYFCLALYNPLSKNIHFFGPHYIATLRIYALWDAIVKVYGNQVSFICQWIRSKVLWSLGLSLNLEGWIFPEGKEISLESIRVERVINLYCKSVTHPSVILSPTLYIFVWVWPQQITK